MPNETKPGTDIAKVQREELVVQDNSSFANLLDTGKFEHMWRVAQVFAKSGMVPKQYQGKTEACFVACQMAVRLEVDPFMFMQNTYLSPDGKPAMYGQLAIALVNRRGPFKGPIQFTLTGAGKDMACTAWQTSRATGDRCEVTVSIATAMAEGWYDRNKKWQSIPDMMLRYRSGAWLGRVYAPEALMGMQTLEEVEDVRGELRAGPDGVYVAAERPTRAAFIAEPDSIEAHSAAGPAETTQTGATGQPPPAQTASVDTSARDDGPAPNAIYRVDDALDGGKFNTALSHLINGATSEDEVNAILRANDPRLAKSDQKTRDFVTRQANQRRAVMKADAAA